MLLLYVIVSVLLPESLFMNFPRSILPVDFVVSLVLIGMFRISKRYFDQTLNKGHSEETKRALIIGAGNTGEQIARAMRGQERSTYNPVGFIDDDVMKHGDFIQGLKVYGSRRHIKDLVEKLDVEMNEHAVIKGLELGIILLKEIH